MNVTDSGVSPTGKSQLTANDVTAQKNSDPEKMLSEFLEKHYITLPGGIYQTVLSILTLTTTNDEDRKLVETILASHTELNSQYDLDGKLADDARDIMIYKVIIAVVDREINENKNLDVYKSLELVETAKKINFKFHDVLDSLERYIKTMQEVPNLTHFSIRGDSIKLEDKERQIAAAVYADAEKKRQQAAKGKEENQKAAKVKNAKGAESSESTLLKNDEKSQATSTVYTDEEKKGQQAHVPGVNIGEATVRSKPPLPNLCLNREDELYQNSYDSVRIERAKVTKAIKAYSKEESEILINKYMEDPSSYSSLVDSIGGTQDESFAIVEDVKKALDSIDVTCRQAGYDLPPDVKKQVAQVMVNAQPPELNYLYKKTTAVQDEIGEHSSLDFRDTLLWQLLLYIKVQEIMIELMERKLGFNGKDRTRLELSDPEKVKQYDLLRKMYGAYSHLMQVADAYHGAAKQFNDIINMGDIKMSPADNAIIYKLHNYLNLPSEKRVNAPYPTFNVCADTIDAVNNYPEVDLIRKVDGARQKELFLDAQLPPSKTSKKNIEKKPPFWKVFPVDKNSLTTGAVLSMEARREAGQLRPNIQNQEEVDAAAFMSLREGQESGSQDDQTIAKNLVSSDLANQTQRTDAQRGKNAMKNATKRKKQKASKNQAGRQQEGPGEMTYGQEEQGVQGEFLPIRSEIRQASINVPDNKAEKWEIDWRNFLETNRYILPGTEGNKEAVKIITEDPALYDQTIGILKEIESRYNYGPVLGNYYKEITFYKAFFKIMEKRLAEVNGMINSGGASNNNKLINRQQEIQNQLREAYKRYFYVLGRVRDYYNLVAEGSNVNRISENVEGFINQFYRSLSRVASEEDKTAIKRAIREIKEYYNDYLKQPEQIVFPNILAKDLSGIKRDHREVMVDEISRVKDIRIQDMDILRGRQPNKSPGGMVAQLQSQLKAQESSLAEGQSLIPTLVPARLVPKSSSEPLYQYESSDTESENEVKESMQYQTSETNRQILLPEQEHANPSIVRQELRRITLENDDTSEFSSSSVLNTTPEQRQTALNEYKPTFGGSQFQTMSSFRPVSPNNTADNSVVADLPNKEEAADQFVGAVMRQMTGTLKSEQDKEICADIVRYLYYVLSLSSQISKQGVNGKTQRSQEAEKGLQKMLDDITPPLRSKLAHKNEELCNTSYRNDGCPPTKTADDLMKNIYSAQSILQKQMDLNQGIMRMSDPIVYSSGRRNYNFNIGKFVNIVDEIYPGFKNGLENCMIKVSPIAQYYNNCVGMANKKDL